MDDSHLRASDKRWREAQEWEYRFWQEQQHMMTRKLKPIMRSILLGGKSMGDDWNLWWAEHFDRYEALPDRLENAIELGCGPYTNMRLVLHKRHVNHAYCCDPLARHYVKFKRGWLAQAYRKALILLDDHPIEETPFTSDYFDLVLLINVLDHVKDALVCLRTAQRITKKGGHLLVGQDLSNLEDTKKTGTDIGHPIRIDHQTLDRELSNGFEKIIYRILKREEGRNPAAHYGTYIFMGEKTA